VERREENFQQLPTATEFVAFWEGHRARKARSGMIFYGVWLGVGTVLLLMVKPTWPLPLIVAAIAYFFLAPVVLTIFFRKLYARFTRCPSCGDWIGDDIDKIERLTAWKDREPKWVTISRTGRCPVCGAKVIEMEEERESRCDSDG